MVGSNRGAVAAAWRMFSRARGGNVGVVFGMLSVPILMCAGGAVDYHLAHQTQTTMQKATDAAILAAMSARSLTDAQRAQQAAAIFATNVASSPIASKITPQVNVAQGAGAIVAQVAMPTTLLRVVGITDIPIKVQSRARSFGKKIEMALMTDVTGSMSEATGGAVKLDGLKLAARDLLDIILPDDAPPEAARVALIPFANYVNAGPLAPEVTSLSPTRINSGKTEYLIPCVTERTGKDAATDAAPAPASWIGAAAPGKSSGNYGAEGVCNRSNGGSGSGNNNLLPAVMGLTESKSALLATIDSYTPSGSTAGHLGTAWAWYALSPNWNSIWKLDRAITSYTDPGTAKVAVLMTDGEYNTQYSNTASAQQALDLCTGMKSAGITVYTVGFGMSTANATDIAAMATLGQCATSKDTFFVAYDGEALRKVFTEIGGKISSQSAVLTD